MFRNIKRRIAAHLRLHALNCYALCADNCALFCQHGDAARRNQRLWRMKRALWGWRTQMTGMTLVCYAQTNESIEQQSKELVSSHHEHQCVRRRVINKPDPRGDGPHGDDALISRFKLNPQTHTSACSPKRIQHSITNWFWCWRIMESRIVTMEHAALTGNVRMKQNFYSWIF